MAIDYSLALGTPLPAARVAGEVHEAARTLRLFESAVTSDLILDEGARTSPGTWIRVVDANPRPHDTVTEELGFAPTVRVAFRFDKFTDMSAQKADMVRLVSDLLDRVSGDAVLHFDYEYIMLLRRDGDLSLNERSDIWPTDLLAAVRQPYRRATYAFD